MKKSETRFEGFGLPIVAKALPTVRLSALPKMALALSLMCCVLQGTAALTIQEWCKAANEQTAAIKSGNWQRAAHCSKLVAGGDNVTGVIPVNAAAAIATYSMCMWNEKGTDYKEQAITDLAQAVNFCDMRVKPGCGARITQFMVCILEGKIDGVKFTQNDFLSPIGLHSFLMEMPYAAANQKHQETMARYDRLIGQISASTEVYRRQGEYQAKVAKFYAKQSYENKHHSTFDPNVRPSEDSGRREDWDSRKRIYDIFGK